MKAIVTGYKGFLGARVCKALSEKHEVIGLDKHEADITDYSQIMNFFEGMKPDVVIHCAAVGDIWRCEENPDLGAKVNIIGTRNIASACAETNARLIAVSSDQVYNYYGTGQLREYMNTSPTNFYGITKVQSEMEVLHHVQKHHIVRLSWQYGWHEEGLPNSRDGLLEKLQKCVLGGEKIRYTPNSRQNITFIYDTVDVITAMAEQRLPYGIYNVASENEMTERETMLYIFKRLGLTEKQADGFLEEVPEGKSFDLRTEPYNLKLLGYKMPTFEEGMDRCFRELVNKV